MEYVVYICIYKYSKATVHPFSEIYHAFQNMDDFLISFFRNYIYQWYWLFFNCFNVIIICGTSTKPYIKINNDIYLNYASYRYILRLFITQFKLPFLKTILVYFRNFPCLDHRSIFAELK